MTMKLEAILSVPWKFRTFPSRVSPSKRGGKVPTLQRSTIIDTLTVTAATYSKASQDEGWGTMSSG